MLPVSAVTVLVIFYCQWSLAPDWTTDIWLLVIITIAAHVGLLCRVRCTLVLSIFLLCSLVFVQT
jgi:hypothetical protein